MLGRDAMCGAVLIGFVSVLARPVATVGQGRGLYGKAVSAKGVAEKLLVFSPKNKHVYH
jgi:hypothetical protein